jgi:IstB-like ATP binding protein
MIPDAERERRAAFFKSLRVGDSEARDEKKLLRFQMQIASYELLIVDELGFVPLSKTGAELLFEMLSQRYERGSTMVTSNLPFQEWTEVRMPGVCAAQVRRCGQGELQRLRNLLKTLTGLGMWQISGYQNPH